MYIRPATVGLEFAPGLFFVNGRCHDQPPADSRWSTSLTTERPNMASKFLAELFRKAEFPPAVSNMVVSTYVDAYEYPLSKNLALGDAAAALVVRPLPFDDIKALFGYGTS